MTSRRASIQPPTSSIKNWIIAARPKTLWAAVAPVVIGTAMAVEADVQHGPSMAVALLCAVLIQIGTNFSNDYLDYVKGADNEQRQGPPRATQAGLISVEAMRRATAGAFGLAFLAGLYLVYRGGWPVLGIGVASIAAGVWYTAGRWSLAYLGLGDLAVLIFFGPVAVGGTYYVQALAFEQSVLVAGLAPGLLATGILMVNNIRDAGEDTRAGKKTIVVRLGRPVGRWLYLLCLLGAALVPVGLFLTTGRHPWAMITLVILPGAGPMVRRLWTRRNPKVLNTLLASTAKLLLAYSVLFSLGWNL